MKKIDTVLCETCIHDFKINGVKCCRKIAPNWGVENKVFVCEDYKKKESKNDEKKKSN